MVPCVSQIMGKNKTFPLNQKLTCANHGIYAATSVICHKQYVGKPKTNFLRDGHRTTVIGTDPIVKLTKITKIKWPCCSTFQSSMATSINHRYMRLTSLLLLKLIPFLWISVKISGITTLTHKLIFKAWSSSAYDNHFVSLLLNADVFQFYRPFLCFTFRGQCAGIVVCVSQSFSIMPAETWLPQNAHL